ncbi:hypothetical protein AALO_G00008420 [Alosa alosa]|uniref:Hemogen n=1 Tax=Alosa alosa TaxID=278164 RepID=A0AAV6HHX9_9TELE|nr:hypothetical protein AALO_G00008420 [Alosa alosa]
MEQTIEKDNLLPERKDPNDEEGGIRRRLRDRDLLKKRKAEAEEKATNQWVYGAQSKRQRGRREERSGTVTASGSAEEVFIEDLGPDEEEDLPLPQGNLIIDQGASEESPADVPEQKKTFSYPLFASPPPQQEYLPGNFI